jgi:pimeloyl-ACP methyl ester carboxylesterase
MPAAPSFMQTLVGRFDPSVFDPRRRRTWIRLAVSDENAWDVLVADGVATIAAADASPDAVLTADADTWRHIAADLRGGMGASQSGRLSVRRNLHVGVGFLAATSTATAPGRLRFRTVATSGARLSIMEAGIGPPVLALHGLGGSKRSFLPTVAALAGQFRVIAVDLLGFGDSDKPIGAAYDARFFAGAGIDLLDALGLDRVHVIGNSLGGRIALEIALRHPDRVGRLGLLAPSLAWRRDRPWVPLLRLTRPELGLVPPAGPRSTPQPVRSISRNLTAQRGSGHGCRHCSLMRCSSGVAATGSYRSPSRATSPTHFRALGTSSSTADRSRRSSVPNRPTPRSPPFYPTLPTPVPARHPAKLADLRKPAPGLQIHTTLPAEIQEALGEEPSRSSRTGPQGRVSGEIVAAGVHNQAGWAAAAARGRGPRRQVLWGWAAPLAATVRLRPLCLAS